MIELNFPAYDELESMNSQVTTETHEHCGDKLEEHTTDETTRIYIENLNGLTWDKDGGRWPYVCEAMATLNVDIACFSETNTDTNQYNIRSKMEAICQRQFPHSRLIMAASRYESTSAYKPGGTAILACNAMTSIIKNHTRDRMGRWTSISLSTKTTKQIRIISAYQVCSTMKPGSNTASSQQQAQIIEESSATDSSQRKNPRQAFIHDLQTFIQQIQSNDEDIILVGDFNEEMAVNGSGIDQLATNCALADLFSIRLGSPRIPATYQRGSRRIDFVLISPSLLPHIQAAGYDPFGYRLPSDHRGMYIDFSTEALLQQDVNPLEPADKRDFSTTSPEVVVKYVTAKMEYLVGHRFFDRMETLNSLQEPDPYLAESLDRDLQRAARLAARKCSR